ncbi:MAG TPA: hypothetical protein VK674_00890 [Candidatus Limnocylindria bacterium]|nr:hypothetical protein [Candidatus Limnocylindria bacterium]
MRPYLNDLLWLAIIVPIAILIFIAGARTFKALFKDIRMDKWLVFVGVLMTAGSLYAFSQSFIELGARDRWFDQYPVVALAMLLTGLLCTFLPMVLRKRK